MMRRRPEPAGEDGAKVRPATVARRRAVAVVATAVVVGTLIAACGIDSDQVAVTAGSVTTSAGSETASSTVPPAITAFTLPSIPTGDPNTTQSTSPDTSDSPETDPPETDPPDTGGSDQVTPNGVSEAALTTQLTGLSGLTGDAAQCLAHAMFRDLTGEEIDKIVLADTQEEIGPDLVGRFTALLQECLG